MPVISVSRLGKQYRQVKRAEGRFSVVRTLFSRESITRTAVDDVSFEIDVGEAVGYIGPNGAGKSTTIKMLTGILVPTSGDIGYRRFAVVPPDPPTSTATVLAMEVVDNLG